MASVQLICICKFGSTGNRTGRKGDEALVGAKRTELQRCGCRGESASRRYTRFHLNVGDETVHGGYLPNKGTLSFTTSSVLLQGTTNAGPTFTPLQSAKQ